MTNSELEASSNRAPARVRRPAASGGRSTPLSVPVAYLTVSLPKVLSSLQPNGIGRASAASRGVQLVLLPLVDGVAAVASAVGGEVTEADRDDDDGEDPQGVRGEAD